MMASNLIKELQALIDSHGDLPVTTGKPDQMLGVFLDFIKGVKVDTRVTLNSSDICFRIVE
jgi:hypothetical protein